MSRALEDNAALRRPLTRDFPPIATSHRVLALAATRTLAACQSTPDFVTFNGRASTPTCLLPSAASPACRHDDRPSQLPPRRRRHRRRARPLPGRAARRARRRHRRALAPQAASKQAGEIVGALRWGRPGALLSPPPPCPPRRTACRTPNTRACSRTPHPNRWRPSCTCCGGKRMAWPRPPTKSRH